MKSFVARSRWAAVGAAVAVALGGGAMFVANAATSSTEFVAVRPCRLLDTRAGVQKGVFASRIGPTQPLGNNQLLRNDVTVIFDPNAVGALGECTDLPAYDPDSVVMNVTVVNSSANSFVTIYPWQDMTGDAILDADPDAAGRPFISQLNPAPNWPPISNSVTVELGVTEAGYTIPGVLCDGGNCGGYKAFRIYNDSGLTDIFIDVVGFYYKIPPPG